MLDPEDFKVEVLEPALTRFTDAPGDLACGFFLIWAIDAYATHVALSRETYASRPSDVEKAFKDGICDAGCWEYKLIREASNATKHGLRDVRRVLPHVASSSDVSGHEVDGWSAYWSDATYWGDQIV